MIGGNHDDQQKTRTVGARHGFKHCNLCPEFYRN